MTKSQYEYEETYKNIKFCKTKKGYWLFCDYTKNFCHWNRYFTKEELNCFNDKTSDSKIVKLMHTAISRMWNNHIMYIGDMRYR